MTRLAAICLLIPAYAAAGNLVQNGTFDTGTDGWTIQNVSSEGGWRADGGNPGGHVILNCNADGPSITQIVSGLTAGLAYEVSGDYALHLSTSGSPLANSFGVAVDNVFRFESAQPDNTDYRHFAFDFVAQSTAATLFLQAERNGTDISYRVDNISMVQVPEPGTASLFGLSLILLLMNKRAVCVRGCDGIRRGF